MNTLALKIVNRQSSIANRKHRGIGLLWLIISFMALLAFMTLAIEAGRIYVTSHQLQNAADSAALIGARFVPDPNSPSPGYHARLMARQYALLNNTLDTAQASTGINLNMAGDTTALIEMNMSLPPAALWPTFNDGDIYIGRYVDHSRLFFKNDPDPDAMLVVARKDGTVNQKLPLPLASIFKVTTASMQKYAIAKAFNPYGAGMLALGNCNCPGITFSGKGSIDDLVIFGGGSLYVNSSSSESIDVDGNIVISLDRIYTVGGIDPKLFTSPSDLTHTDIIDNLGPEGVEPDPYAAVPNAVYSTTPDLGTIAASGTYSPGYYSGGIQVSTTGTSITLLPGNYYLDSIGTGVNASLSMTGGSLAGEGVTLHIIGNANTGVDVGGNANIDISAPTSGPYAGIAIFQKRNLNWPDCAISCSKNPVSELGGTGSIIIDGAVYMPHNKLNLGGTGDISMTRTVADRFEISGTSQKVVNYKGQPKIAETSYLVE